MAPQARDWDKELAKIDAIIAKQTGQQPVPAPAGAAEAPAKAPPRARPAAGDTRRKRAGTWGRVALAAVLAVAMTQWPYAHDCGWPLFAYLGGAAAVGGAGVWSAWTSWARRLAIAHAVSVLLIAWGAVLVAQDVIPRIDGSGQTAAWMCPSP